MPEKIVFERSEELDEMGRILDALPGMKRVCKRVLADLGESTSGRGGLTAEQVVKFGILRKRYDMTYRELSHASSDSLSIRRFLELELSQVISKSCIHQTLKSVQETTWELLNEELKKFAIREGIEDGEIIRADTTATQTNIHFPTDASLLNDTVRTLCRTMKEVREILGKKTVKCVDHRRRAKAKLYRINNTRREEKRHADYLELMRVTQATLTNASKVASTLKSAKADSTESKLLLERCRTKLETFIDLGGKIWSQARRRIINKEKVPSDEKVVSLFESHTDIIVKGSRDPIFGHKVSVVTGASGLLLNVSVLDGNPADSTLVSDILADHKKSYGQAPKAAAFDGCFASIANRDELKKAGVKELTFSKNGKISLRSLASSSATHRVLVRFRAGVEGNISFLKRVFGFRRVMDKGLASFQAALQCAAVACNLTLLARRQIATQT